MELLITVLVAAVSAGTALLLASLGAILCERAGIINLGIEGMMLMGAVIGFMVGVSSGQLVPALLAAMMAGGLLGFIHAVLTVSLKANQIVSGLAVTLFGEGLSAYLGKPVAGTPLPLTIPQVEIPMLSNLPVLGRVLFQQDILVWLSLGIAVLMWLYFYKTSWGLQLRALGEDPATADVMGVAVTRGRYLYVIAGSMLAGLAGAYLSLAYSPTWSEGMTAGRGWIAVGLVIFARWNPLGAVAGAYLFGGFDALGLRLQSFGSAIPSYFLKMMPYVLTVVVLILIHWRAQGAPTASPGALGKPYERESR